MALVSYDVSDASSSEDEEPEETPLKVNTLIQSQSSKDTASDRLRNIVDEDPSLIVNDQNLPSKDEDDFVTLENDSVFSVLPSPKHIPEIIDSDFSKKLLLNRPSTLPEKPSLKKTVKITLPSLVEFDDDLPRPVVKKVAPSSKGTGLFALLPPPKNSGTAATLKLIPDSLKKLTPLSKPVKKMAVKPVPRIPVKVPVVEDSDSDDESSGDFLGLNRPVNPEPVVVLPPFVPEPVLVDKPIHEELIPEPDHYETSDFVPVETEALSLDDEAIAKLCGGSKRKRTAMQAELIDINETEIRPDKDEWLMKALTEEKPTRSHKKSGGPSGQSKRKHQITYLAYQAKANEQDLQNQWSQNRMTKRQTQSKYGF